MYILIPLAIIVVLSTISNAINDKLRELVYRNDVFPCECKRDTNDICQDILKEGGAGYVTIAHTRGEMTDHYFASGNTLFLSDTSWEKNTIGAITVAAHECGHAMQHAQGFWLYKLNNVIHPIASFCSKFSAMIGYLGLVIIPIFFGLTHGLINVDTETVSAITGWLYVISMFMYTLAVAYYAFASILEKDASARALQCMAATNCFDDYELKTAKKILDQAGKTYWAGFANALAIFVMLKLVFRGRR